MADLLGLARKRLDDWQIWVNPDCGLKTRKWEEVRPALENLVAAARRLRRGKRRLRGVAAPDRRGRPFLTVVVDEGPYALK